MKKLFLYIFQGLLWYNISFAKVLIFRCDLETMTQDSKKNKWEVLENRKFKFTIKNNKELYLHNYNTNDSDDWPFIIISNQKKYFIAQFDKSNNTSGIWIETITFRKNDGFTVYLSTTSMGQTVYDGYCTNPS